MSVSKLAERFESVARIDPAFERDAETRYRYLLSLRNQAQEKLSRVDRTGYSTRTALASESELNARVSERAPYWAGAALSAYLNVDTGLRVENRTYRDWVLLQYDKAAAGIPYLHPDMVQRMVATGKVQEGWTIDDWRRRCRTFQALVTAGEKGALEPIYEGNFELEGLGIAWGVAVPIIIAIVAVVVIAAIAWVIGESAKTSQMNQHYQAVIDQVCTAPDGSWRSTPECQSAIKNAMDKDRDKTQMQVLVEQGIRYGAVILGAYVLARLLLNRVSGPQSGTVVIRTGAT